jgi:hypothetical protein
VPIQPTRVELIYLPYYFFDITLSQEVGTQLVGVAVDAVLGATVFFIGDALVRTPGCNKRTVSIQEISAPERIHYPFWVAYFKRRGSYDFKALDAVSGEVQGVKMRKVFLAAFRQSTD